MVAMDTASRMEGNIPKPPAADGSPATASQSTSSSSSMSIEALSVARTSSPPASTTSIILAMATGLFLLVVGFQLAGAFGAFAGVLLAGVVYALGPHVPVERMLALYRAQPLLPGQGASLQDIATTLSMRAGLTNPPAIAVVPSLASGAFAVGSSEQSAILVTEGLLRRHSMPEIAAIFAHEIAHILASDTKFFALADTVTRLAQLVFYAAVAAVLVNGLLWLAAEPLLPWLPIALMFAAPLLSSLLQLLMPRAHDLAADRLAASLMGDRALIVKVAAAASTQCGTFLDDLRLPVPQRRVPLPSPLRAHVDGPVRARRLAAEPHLGSAPYPPLHVADGPLVSLAGVGPVEMRPRDRWPGVWF